LRGLRELVTLGAERGDCEGIAERVLATRGRLYGFLAWHKVEQLASVRH